MEYLNEILCDALYIYEIYDDIKIIYDNIDNKNDIINIYNNTDLILLYKVSNLCICKKLFNIVECNNKVLCCDFINILDRYINFDDDIHELNFNYVYDIYEWSICNIKDDISFTKEELQNLITYILYIII